MPLCFYTVCSRFSVKHLLSYMSFFINIISNIFFIPVLLRYLDWIWFFFHVVIFFYKKASLVIAVMSKPIWNKILPWWINKSINPDCKLEYRYCVLLCLLIMSIFFYYKPTFLCRRLCSMEKTRELSEVGRYLSYCTSITRMSTLTNDDVTDTL